MNTSQSLFIPGPLPGMNEIVAAAKGMRGRGILYSVMKRKWNERGVAAINAANLTAMVGPIHVVFHWCEASKRRDPDNFASGKKFILDSLVDAGIIEGDGWRHISGFSDSWEVNKGLPGVIVEIRSCGENL